jgi:hypothetical protein
LGTANGRWLLMKSYENLIEELVEMMTSSGVGVAGMHVSHHPGDNPENISGREPDRLAIKPRKKRKLKETFAGCPVFTVTSEDYNKCMHGRMKYERWNKKLNMEEMDNQDIRVYAHRNPGKAIIVKDSTYGTMSYLIPSINESVNLDEYSGEYDPEREHDMIAHSRVQDAEHKKGKKLTSAERRHHEDKAYHDIGYRDGHGHQIEAEAGRKLSYKEMLQAKEKTPKNKIPLGSKGNPEPIRRNKK